jgi:hypothetical protein
MDLEMRLASRARDVIGIVCAALRRRLSTLSGEDLGEAHTAAKNWVWRDEDRLIAERAAAFVAAGGCPSCAGHGTVVVWDTMDSMSGAYAEHGPCPRSPEAAARTDGYSARFNELPADAIGTCTTESREASGLSTATPRHYRGIGQNTKGDTIGDWPWTNEEKHELASARDALSAIEAELAERVIAVGRPVRVTRGFRVVAGKRKGRGALPLGLEGEIEWKGETRYGVRVKLRVGEGENEFVWTSPGNVEVIR